MATKDHLTSLTGNVCDDSGVRTGEGRGEIADAMLAGAFVSRGAVEDVLSRPDGVEIIKDAVHECTENGVDSLAIDTLLGLCMDVAVRKGDAISLETAISLGASAHRASGQVG